MSFLHCIYRIYTAIPLDFAINISTMKEIKGTDATMSWQLDLERYNVDLWDVKLSL